MNSVQLVDESGFKAPRFIREEKKKFLRGVTPDYAYGTSTTNRHGVF
jgi:hypothetical protein